MRGLDYSVGAPGGRAIDAAGFKFVVRYLAYPGARPKYLTRPEAQDMLGRGIAIALVWETTAGRALAGRAAGTADARIAASSARDVGQPTSRPIYFAVDVDITNAAEMAKVDAYLDGVADVLGRDRVGVYGEHDVIEHCLAAGRAQWGWQTKAWSHGRVSARAHLLQEIGGVTVGGVSCDVNTARQADFGQWPAPNGEDDMPLNDADKAAIKGIVDERIRRLVPRVIGMAITGQGNAEFGRPKDPNMDPAGWARIAITPQLTAQIGALTGLVQKLAAGGGLTAEQIEAAAQAGARAALAELGEKLSGEAAL